MAEEGGSGDGDGGGGGGGGGGDRASGAGEAAEGIELREIPEGRFDDVIEHLRHNFFADEPLNRAVALCRPGEPHAELERHALATLRDGLSCMAVVRDTGEVAGVALNGVTRPGDVAAARARLAAVADAKFRRIFGLLYGEAVAAAAEALFVEHGVEALFECRILSVDRRFRGRGLARELLVRSEAIARERGFKVMKEDATGLYSQRVADSCGLRTVAEVRYEDYKSEETGEPAFQLPPPHQSLKIMVKTLY